MATKTMGLTNSKKKAPKNKSTKAKAPKVRTVRDAAAERIDAERVAGIADGAFNEVAAAAIAAPTQAEIDAETAEAKAAAGASWFAKAFAERATHGGDELATIARLYRLGVLRSDGSIDDAKVRTRAATPRAGRVGGVLGFSATAILLWLGRQQYGIDDARKVMAHYGAKPSETTFRVYLTAGRTGRRAEPPALNDEQAAEIRGLLA